MKTAILLLCIACTISNQSFANSVKKERKKAEINRQKRDASMQRLESAEKGQQNLFDEIDAQK